MTNDNSKPLAGLFVTAVVGVFSAIATIYIVLIGPMRETFDIAQSYQLERIEDASETADEVEVGQAKVKGMLTHHRSDIERLDTTLDLSRQLVIEQQAQIAELTTSIHHLEMHVSKLQARVDQITLLSHEKLEQ